MCETDLVLFEVAQGLDDDGAGALIFRVSGFQSHNALGSVDQMLNLPLVFHNLLLLPLEIIHTHNKINNNNSTDQ